MVKCCKYKNSPGHYQYVSLVCKTHSKSQEELSDTFFPFEMNSALDVKAKKEKKYQTIPPWTLNVFYILVIHTDNAKVSFVLITLCQPGGAAINFSKSLRNQNQTILLH